MKPSVPSVPVVTRLFASVVIPALALSGSSCSDQNPTTPAAGATVSFSADIKPLLQANCIMCHNGAALMGGLNLETREKAFRPSERGAIIIPGNADSSLLYTSTAQLHGKSDDPAVMPADGILLSDAERDLLKRWIDQGADWPSGPEGTIETPTVTPGA